MKKFRGFIIIFLGIGVLMLSIAALLWNHTRSFLARAQETTGTVVELREVRDKDGGSSTWKPVVKFTTARGRNITFAESFSSSPAPYDVGEPVTVLYLPDEPEEARIRGFGSLWLGATIVGGIGLVFTLIGGGILFANRTGERKKHYLMAYGNAIETEVQGVERNTSLEINGKHPWRIASQWLDPGSNAVRIFYSENLWFDPSSFVKRKQVTVLLDPNNPKRYHMDVSFLPELER
ncbi:MAG TPA: DUF3592 domain-containing protein [Steroidobacteraceae bacterium]|jgi:hypothetical protein|nr:DUF3592 domain-containing protein [Steroidobacteraceae bacterium]